MIGWMQYLKDQLNPLGVAVVANIKAATAPQQMVLKAINAVDAWLDENGFVHRGINYTDKKWEDAVAIINKIAPDKGYISINQLKGETASDWLKEQIEYAIGSYLLTRGPKSLLAMVGYTDKTIYHHYLYRSEMDADIGEAIAPPVKEASGLWTRKFSKGMVIVNPSSKQVQSINLPKGNWKTLENETVKGTLSLPPASARVLANSK